MVRSAGFLIICGILGMLPDAQGIMNGDHTGDASKDAEAYKAYGAKVAQEEQERRGRYELGNFSAWWEINRDEFLLLPPTPDSLNTYEDRSGKKPPPDTLEDLLPLIGYSDYFSTQVLDLAVRRMKRIPKVDEALSAILNDPRALAPKRAWAAYAMGELKSSKSIPTLLKALKEKDRDIRAFSALALTRIADVEACRAILPLLDSKKEDEDLKCLALLGLAECQSPEVRKMMLRMAGEAEKISPGRGRLSNDLIEKPGIHVRRAAILALGVKSSEAEISHLADLTEDKDQLVRCAALISLGIARKRTDILLSGLQNEPEALCRGHAAVALGIARTPGAIQPLITLLKKDRDPVVRACAALALGHFQSEEAVAPLAEARASRNDFLLSDYAAIGLGLSGKATALPPLLEGLASKRNDMINASEMGLLLLKDPESLPALLKMLDYKQFMDVPQFALLAIGNLKKPESFETIQAKLDDKSWGTRVAASFALLLHGNAAKACPILEAHLATEKQPVTRNTIALAFDWLTQDEKRKLTLGDGFKGDPRNQNGRKVSVTEITRELNRHFPKDFKLPIAP